MVALLAVARAAGRPRIATVLLRFLPPEASRSGIHHSYDATSISRRRRVAAFYCKTRLAP